MIRPFQVRPCSVYFGVVFMPSYGFLSLPQVQFAWGAHMHRFLSVVWSVRTGPKIVDRNSYVRKFHS